MHEVFDYIQSENEELYNSIFVDGKLHKAANNKNKISFHQYLDATSPFGILYTSYQFFRPKDASPELSDDNNTNKEVANLEEEMHCDDSLVVFDEYERFHISV
ncbi:hypothetical protein JF544_18735 [Halobacillus kuroshimensis]|uniref:Uncharacterized protein n=1 Tax=Halobacillus kuroshimensis TaxID=302481 RepID=A0ABS3E120_9BACI|nr:hypothetical protein [Halobacillus kuroshimensis]MBN8237286.1 hypothetical protein [Halobacillus kuroshimensis]